MPLPRKSLDISVSGRFLRPIALTFKSVFDDSLWRAKNSDLWNSRADNSDSKLLVWASTALIDEFER